MNLEEIGNDLNGWIARTIMVPAIADEVIARFLEDAEFAEWEDFADIGEHDWNRVLEAVKQKAKDIRPPKEAFESAYKWLAERADKEVT